MVPGRALESILRSLHVRRTVRRTGELWYQNDLLERNPGFWTLKKLMPNSSYVSVPWPDLKSWASEKTVLKKQISYGSCMQAKLGKHFRMESKNYPSTTIGVPMPV